MGARGPSAPPPGSVKVSHETRMHSSRMHTARSSSHLGVSTRHPPGTRHPPEQTPRTRHPPGPGIPLGADLPRDQAPPGPGNPPVNRMTNRCKHITLPQTSFAGGKMAVKCHRIDFMFLAPPLTRPLYPLLACFTVTFLHNFRKLNH